MRGELINDDDINIDDKVMREYIKTLENSFFHKRQLYGAAAVTHQIEVYIGKLIDREKGKMMVNNNNNVHNR